MASKKIQLYTDRANTIEASPETSANCVILSDGNDLQKVLDNDLTNPTVVHEETSFKVGAGDIDVSSSVVDGEVGRMVIKGKTYQNILPEPSTHVLTNNKEMFKVNEGLDPNVEIVDGVSKSAILSGSTERRVSKNLFNGRIKNNADINSATGQESATGSRTISLDYTPVLPSTEYTFTRPINTKQMGYRLYRSDKSFIKFQALGNNLSATFTTTSDTAYFKFIDEANTLTEGYQLELGSVATEYEPYFEPHLISCKLPVLCTTGKNLFDSSTEIVTGQGINSTNGLPYNISSHSCTGFLRVKSNTTYTITQSHNRTWVFAYNKNKEYIKVVKTDILSGGNFTTPNDTYYIRLDFNTANTSEIVNGVQIEEGSVATSYEPYKTNILHTPEEVVLRSLPNGVCDTLNLMTGEYVQRIKEIVLDGSSRNDLVYHNVLKEHDGQILRMIINNCSFYNKSKYGNCDKLPFYHTQKDNTTLECVFPYNGDNHFYIQIKTSRIDGADSLGHLSAELKQSFCNWLAQNPLTVQYELATPIVKTVDLSSSGNWMELTLTGEEEWRDSGNTPYITPSVRPKKGLTPFSNGEFVGVDRAESFACFWLGGGTNTPNGNLVFYHPMVKNAIQMKEFLRNNPQKIYYYVEDGAGNIKQPIFFKDGHIIQSSGTDNSLIPTLDYQAKTSNSYVMDLMKTGTTYTIKASSVSGTATIGNAGAFTLNTNRTIVSPSSSLMDNKLLVIKGSATDLIILEGDVTDKTIPYFKGIKSAFEGESKIEVLSTGKNLCDSEPEAEGYYVRYQNGVYAQHDSFGVSKPIRVIEGHRYRLINTNKNHAYYDKNMNYVTTPLFSGADTDFYSIAPKNAVYLRVSMMKGLEAVVNTDGTKGEYREPNSTKIPLLSPLRSLPNGVCDELIIDRMKKKATLIQRVGYTELNGDNSEQWGVDVQKNSRSGFVTRKQYNQKVAGGQNAIVAEHLLAIDDTGRKYDLDYTITMGNIPTYPFVITIPSHIINERGDSFTTIDNAVSKFKRWLSKAPISVVYQLTTPVVTEIDLENFPLVYKDGHIFLNSEIAPVVEIDYNVNQAQQIQANNETLQRHELDILDLDNLIISFVNAEYNLRLLKFDMELSMMALAE